MDRLIPNLCHLLFELRRHHLDHVGVRRIMVTIEQLQRIPVAVEQLPLFLFLVIGVEADTTGHGAW